MSFLNKLFTIGTSIYYGVIDATIRQEEEILKKIDRKVSKAERQFDNLNSEQQNKVIEAREKLDKISLKRGYSRDNKSLQDWDREWINIGNLQTADLTPYNKSIGLYRHVIDGETVYIGRATEINNGGFRKRLNDYIRESDSGRKHKSGQNIYRNLDRITTYLLIVGDAYDTENYSQMIKLTNILEKRFIAKYRPHWNVQHNIF